MPNKVPPGRNFALKIIAVPERLLGRLEYLLTVHAIWRASHMSQKLYALDAEELFK